MKFKEGDRLVAIEDKEIKRFEFVEYNTSGWRTDCLVYNDYNGAEYRLSRKLWYEKGRHVLTEVTR